MSNVSEILMAELRQILSPENIITSGEQLETLSKDFYWYSPVLKRQLESKSAEVIVRPENLEQIRSVLSACSRAKVPVVPRGAGTGNYGQCVPLYAGVVMDLSKFDRILSITDGVVRAETGARLGTIEGEARAVGWELRCIPSTWVKASIGGFFCGGSGGIGSITWGGISSPGNVKSVTVMTCEESPKLIRLEEEKANKALHTYGTTGVMIEIEMRLAPKVAYEQIALSHPSWDQLLDWTDDVARNVEWRKRLVTQFEWPIPSFFKPLAKYLRDGEALTFLLIEVGKADEVIASAQAAGLNLVFRRPLGEPAKPPLLTDYTWNHTTLWAIKADARITYVQSGFGQNFREQFKLLQTRFPGEILFHLEWTAGNSKMRETAETEQRVIGVGGIPLVYFRSEERLAEIIDYCREIGVFIANPHTYVLEEGGRHPNISEKRDLKKEVDPHGLLNPGKMKSYPYNPFASADETQASRA